MARKRVNKTTAVRWETTCLFLVLIPTSPLQAATKQPAVAHSDWPSDLVAHFDAAEIADEDLRDGEFVKQWKDRISSKNPLVQSNPEHQPRLHRIGAKAVVRFNGKSWLQRITEATELQEATLILVTAPHENPGGWRGFVSAGTKTGRDYQTGWNLDMGDAPTSEFSILNAEGAGFSGAKDLNSRSLPFGQPVVISCVIDHRLQRVQTFIDAALVGSRSRRASMMQIEQLTVGARYYNNVQPSQEVTGELSGDIAEILCFSRALSGDEVRDVTKQLDAKWQFPLAALTLPDRLSGSQPLQLVANPPDVQLLVPGFQVRNVPVELPNLNNIRCRPDGTVTALGYNGNLYRLQDTNGDGLPDQSSVFWENDGTLRGPIGMQLTPEGSTHGDGVFVASKGRVSLITDTTGDQRADKVRVLASGWEEIPQNVDAVGLAVDDDGAVYFGIGTANYANAYLLDDQGRAHYDLRSVRGTVQRISPDFSEYRTVCTGIRFPIGMEFNKKGDLFCTDQEGATWLPNGNPFDELLHIQTDRHYGFPPRHPKHNPSVVDEPSVFNFGPQHQSTCGMLFNDSDNPELATFGPDWWRGDALICGESRGRIWRTRLVNTSAGYVATSQLIAVLQMLTVDHCLLPDGSLLVCCHSGPPDWGTGPAGTGKLFVIQPAGESVPRPVAAWRNAADEVRISFDHPVPVDELARIRDQIMLHHGPYVAAGDRFTHLVPPYRVVEAQRAAPRYAAQLNGLSVTPDLRTIILHSNPEFGDDPWSVSLPTAHADSTDAVWTELDATANGVEVTLSTRAKVQKAWLPHTDGMVNRHFLQGSPLIPELKELCSTADTVTIKTRLEIRDLLKPAVQPGEILDHTSPAEDITLVIKSPTGSGVSASDAEVQANRTEDGVVSTIRLRNRSAPTLLLTVDFARPIDVLRGAQLSFANTRDTHLRPVSPARLHQPWVLTEATGNAPKSAAPHTDRRLADGSWGRGRRLFHGSKARCSECHQINRLGGNIGPDLSNLKHRSPDGVIRDIADPGYSINPDYVSRTLTLTDGRILSGVLQSEGTRLLVGQTNGKQVAVRQREVESMTVNRQSVMPRELWAELSAQEQADLLAFLIGPPPGMPLDSPLQAPPPRTLAEVQEVLAGAPSVSSSSRPLHIVLVAGKKDHGPGEHDYPAWQVQWRQLLLAATHTDVSTAWDFPSDAQLDAADILIFFQKGDWTDERAAGLDRFLQRGGGAVYIHWAVNGQDRVAEFADRIGLSSKGGSIRFRHGPLTLNLHNTDHPILRNMPPLDMHDESYWLLTGDRSQINLLGTSHEDGEERPQVWTCQRGKGRVFVSIPGHYSWSFDDPLFRILLLRGIAWTAGEPVDRFNELVLPGARIRH